MGLCGASTHCGCTAASSVATTNAVNGQFPSIAVAGNGAVATPFTLAMDANWATEVAAAVGSNYAWQPWVPVISQPGVLTKTIDYAFYRRSGANLKTITCVFSVDPTTNGTAGNPFRLTSLPAVPVAAMLAQVPITVGEGILVASIGADRYRFAIELIDSDTVQFASDRAATATAYLGVTPSLSWQETTRGTFTYEAA